MRGNNEIVIACWFGLVLVILLMFAGLVLLAFLDNRRRKNNTSPHPHQRK